jgi:hypothetical protein
LLIIMLLLPPELVAESVWVAVSSAIPLWAPMFRVFTVTVAPAVWVIAP